MSFTLDGKRTEAFNGLDTNIDRKGKITSDNIYHIAEDLSKFMYRDNNIDKFKTISFGQEKMDLTAFKSDIGSDENTLQINIQTFLLQKIIKNQADGLIAKNKSISEYKILDQIYDVWKNQDFWKGACETVSHNAKLIAEEMKQTIDLRADNKITNEEMWLRIFAIDETANELKADGATRYSENGIKAMVERKQELMKKDTIFMTLSKEGMKGMVFDARDPYNQVSRVMAKRLSTIDSYWTGLEKNKIKFEKEQGLIALGDEYRDCELKLLGTGKPEQNFDSYLSACVKVAGDKAGEPNMTPDLDTFTREADTMLAAIKKEDHALMASKSSYGELKKDIEAYQDYMKSLNKLSAKGKLDPHNLSMEQMDKIAGFYDRIQQHAMDYGQYKAHHHKGTELEKRRIDTVQKIYDTISARKEEMHKYIMKTGLSNSSSAESKKTAIVNKNNQENRKDNKAILEQQIQMEVHRNVKTLTAIMGKGFGHLKKGTDYVLSEQDKKIVQDCKTKLLLCSWAKQNLDNKAEGIFKFDEKDKAMMFGEMDPWFKATTAMTTWFAQNRQVKAEASKDITLSSVRDLVAKSGDMSKELQAVETRIMEVRKEANKQR